MDDFSDALQQRLAGNAELAERRAQAEAEMDRALIEEAEEVAPPRSPRSHRKTFSPRPAASRAIPQPLMPPPMMARS